ncbi:hypothetical protein VP01_1311g4 [Puccinia sorghi]|uniref:Uncharacterized protein n=1 Tax=Puccinia sorghi TaxID=27349 RepID=A0A0L6VMX5_9BASI|nr:hypothetical protein VP01_1311g4 [Puccinia sorghi]
MSWWFFTISQESNNTYIHMKDGYIHDILVPKAMILTTQQEFLDEAVGNADAHCLAIDHLKVPETVTLININTLRKSK